MDTITNKYVILDPKVLEARIMSSKLDSNIYYILMDIRSIICLLYLDKMELSMKLNNYFNTESQLNILSSVSHLNKMSNRPYIEHIPYFSHRSLQGIV